MRNLRSRVAPIHRAPMAVEELEARTQPALISLGLVGNVLVSVELPVAASVQAQATAEVTVPAHANISAHLTVGAQTGPADPGEPPPGNSPPTPPPLTTPPGGGTTAPPPTFTPPTGTNPAAPSPNVSMFASPLAANNPTTPVASASASASLLLPPEVNDSVAPTASVAALPPEAAAAPQFTNASLPTPAGAPVLYYTAEVTTPRPAQYGSPAAVGAADGVNPPAVPLAATPRADRATDPVAETALPALPLMVVEEEAASETAPVPAPLAAQQPVEESLAPWMWAAILLGTIGGAAWATRHYWLKRAAVVVPPEQWRSHLLGLDFDRI